MAEVGGLGQAFEHPFLAHSQFILKDQFQKIRVAQPVLSVSGNLRAQHEINAAALFPTK